MKKIVLVLVVAVICAMLIPNAGLNIAARAQSCQDLCGAEYEKCLEECKGEVNCQFDCLNAVWACTCRCDGYEGGDSVGGCR